MKTSNVNKVSDLGYRDGGYVQCACGWRKELGNGFNGYHIDNCPACTPELETRVQRKVITGSVGNYTATIGAHVYFILSNGIHIQYSRRVDRTYTGLSIQRADNL